MPQASVSLSMSYDARNFPVSQNRSNGVSSAFTYDPLARVLSIAWSGGSNVLANFSYTYDPAGNRAGVTTNLAQALTTQATTGTFDAADEDDLLRRTDFHLRYQWQPPDRCWIRRDHYLYLGRPQPATSIAQPNGTVTSFTYDFARNLTRQSVSGGGTTATTSYLFDDITNAVAIYGGNTGTLSLLTGSGFDDHFATVNSLGRPSSPLTMHWEPLLPIAAFPPRWTARASTSHSAKPLRRVPVSRSHLRAACQ